MNSFLLIFCIFNYQFTESIAYSSYFLINNIFGKSNIVNFDKITLESNILYQNAIPCQFTDVEHFNESNCINNETENQDNIKKALILNENEFTILNIPNLSSIELIFVINSGSYPFSSINLNIPIFNISEEHYKEIKLKNFTDYEIQSLCIKFSNKT